MSAQVNPVASKAAIVVVGNARFTVLTDCLIRMERSEDGKFEERASFAIINRNIGVSSFTVARKGRKTVIKTSSVCFKLNGKVVAWRPGMKPEGNLKCTIRTQDCIDGHISKSVLSYYGRDKDHSRSPVEMEDGILSRDGWAIVDDSQRHLLQREDSDWGEWVSTRQENERQDLYIFAYGHDYKAAFADYIKVAGRIPLPPVRCVYPYLCHQQPSRPNRPLTKQGA